MSTYSDVLDAARKIGPGALIPVTVVSNQHGGIVGYADGALHYQPAKFLGRFALNERLYSDPSRPLQYLFSNRNPKGGSGFSDQPFDEVQEDKLGVSLSAAILGAPIAHFTLVTWGNAPFSVSLADGPGTLSGPGPAIAGSDATTATFVISFGDVEAPPK